MPKYRVVKVSGDDLNYKSLSGTALIVDADSEGRAICDVAQRIGKLPQSFQAERIILSDTDRHFFTSSG